MTYQSFDAPKVNAAGQALVVAPYNGVWRGDAPGTLSPVAVVGQKAPGLGGNAQFDQFSHASLNNSGSVAFVGSLALSATSQGVFTNRSGSLALEYATGIQAPEAPAGSRILQYRDLVINDRDQIAFEALLYGADVTNINDTGIWIETPGGLHMVAREGGAAPGASGQTFTAFSSPLINAKGQMVFEGSTSGFDSGLWAYDPSAGLQLITLRSMELPTNDGQTFRPLSIYYAAAGDGGGSPRPFNDLGQFVFAADRGGTGGNYVNSGIYVVNVPEPQALAMCALLLALRRRRRSGGRSNVIM